VLQRGGGNHRVGFSDGLAGSPNRGREARGRGQVCVLVRGAMKVRAIALWHAVVHNLLCAARLRAVAAGRR
jgi:hypothetical protein